MPDPQMRELLENIVKTLVDDADSIRIAELHTEQAFIFELEVSKTDVGKVIGRGGKTAMAIRSILEAASGKLRKRVILEILE